MSHDPLLQAQAESKTFSWRWLSGGESLSMLGRTGFAMLSLFFIAFGLFFARVSADDFREGDFFFAVGFAVATFFFLFFALLGLRNVLSFPQTSAPSPGQK